MRLAVSPAMRRFFDSEHNTAADDGSQQAEREKRVIVIRDLVFKPRTTEKASSPPSLDL
jgi:hypothetical protein